MFSGKKPNYAHSCFLYFTTKSKLVNSIARVNFVTVKYLVCLTLVFHQVLDPGKMGVLSASKRALFSFSSIILNWCPPPSFPATPLCPTVSSHTTHILLTYRTFSFSNEQKFPPCFADDHVDKYVTQVTFWSFDYVF